MTQMTIAQIRSQYPQYQDLNDQQLADAIYTSHYSDMDRRDFDDRIGLTQYWENQFEQATGATAGPEPDRRSDQQRAESFVQARRDQSGVNAPAGFMATGMAEAFNFSDEQAALGARVSNFYDRVSGRDRVPLDPSAVAEAERNRLEQARQEGGLGQTVREAAASAPTMFVGGAGLGGAVRTGAAFGGLAGVGAGETPEDRLASGALGAGVGAVIGGAVQAGGDAVARGLSPLARSVQRRLSGDGRNMTRAQRRAFAELRQAFREEGMSGREAMDALRRYQDAGFDDASLLDLGSPGGPVQRLVRATGTRGGQSGRELEGLLQDRLDSQADRVGQRLSRYLSNVDDFGEQSRELVRAREAASRPLYDEFRAMRPIRRNLRRGHGQSQTNDQALSAELDALFDTPLFMRVARMAKSSAQTRDGVQVSIDGQVSPDVLQRIYATLGEQIREARRAGRKTREGDLMALMTRYRDFLDNAYGGAHARARDAYAGETQLIDALERGRIAFRADAEDVAFDVSQMSDSERQMFRAGLVRAAREQVERTQDGGDVVRRVIGNEDRRRRLAAAFDTPEDFERFVGALRAEQSRVQNARFVAPGTGSQTQMRGADLEREASGTLGDLIRGDFLGAIGRVGYVGRDAARQAQRRATDQEITRIATAIQRQAAPEAQQVLLEQVAQEYGQETAQRVSALLGRTSTPAAITAVNAVNP
ncbi:MAG: hypothetical protein MJH10_10510 [Epibacterium sp.]|nr:hypothetical protein [Epibacterium sp.]NQX73972.1 hypothetical protein [Epibacterium sp.]